MSKLHLVFGGRVKDPRGLDFADLGSIDLVGIFDNYAAAGRCVAWCRAAHRRRGRVKYVIVHLTGC